MGTDNSQNQKIDARLKSIESKIDHILPEVENVLAQREMDSLHLACAIKANTDYFLTTDDGVIKKAIHIQNIQIVDPIGFIKEVSI